MLPPPPSAAKGQDKRLRALDGGRFRVSWSIRPGRHTVVWRGHPPFTTGGPVLRS